MIKANAYLTFFFFLFFFEVQADPKVHRIISWGYFSEIIAEYCENRFRFYDIEKGQLYGDLFKLKIPRHVLVINNGSDQAYPVLTAFYMRYFGTGTIYYEELSKKKDPRMKAAVHKLHLDSYFITDKVDFLSEKKWDVLVLDSGLNEEKIGQIIKKYSPFLNEKGLIWVDISTWKGPSTVLNIEGFKPVLLSSFGDEITFKIFKKVH